MGILSSNNNDQFITISPMSPKCDTDKTLVRLSSIKGIRCWNIGGTNRYFLYLDFKFERKFQPGIEAKRRDDEAYDDAQQSVLPLREEDYFKILGIIGESK